MRFSGPMKENYLFRRLYRRGQSAANAYLVLYAHRNGSARSRVGITVSGKLGCAVQRNRIRRRLREIYRLREDKLCRGTDLVIVARGKSAQATYAQLERAFEKACKQLGILSTESGQEK